jgi:hypothetical protein
MSLVTFQLRRPATEIRLLILINDATSSSLLFVRI